jgi:hypothetical protein
MTTTFDILLDTEDITVLGPPQNIDVSVGIGQEGQRGSKWFVGAGNPNTAGVIPSGEDIQVGDIFINTSTGSNFSWLYVYASGLVSNSWVPALRLQPSIYTRNMEIVFDSNGSGTATIALSDIIADITITNVDNYVVQVTPILLSGHASISINSKSITSGNLIINLSAIEYDTGSWSEFEGTMKIGVTISVV